MIGSYPRIQEPNDSTTTRKSNRRFSNSHYTSANKMSLAVTSKKNMKSPYYLHISENAIINANTQRIFPMNSVFFANQIEQTVFRDFQSTKNNQNPLKTKTDLGNSTSISIHSNILNQESNSSEYSLDSIADPKIVKKVNEINHDVNEIEKSIQRLFIERHEFQEEHRKWLEDRKKKIIQVKTENFYLNNSESTFPFNYFLLSNPPQIQIPNI